MSSSLRAAEALVATCSAGRARLRELSHRLLPFDQALALEMDAFVGASEERVALDLTAGAVDLARLAGALGARAASPEPVSPPGPVSPEPVSPPEPASSPEPAAVAAVGVPADPPPAAVAADASGDDEATQVWDAPEDLLAALRAADPTPSVSPSPLPDLGDEPDTDDIPKGVALQELVRGPLPDPERNPFDGPAGTGEGEADLGDELVLDEDDRIGSGPLPVSVGTVPRVASASLVPDPSAAYEPALTDPAPLLDEGPGDPEEEPTAVIGRRVEAEPTMVAQASAELRSAMKAPRAVSPAMGVRAAAPPRAEDDSGGYEPTHVGAAPSFLDPPRLIEHDSFDKTPSVAAVQILGVGQARAVTPTLELESARFSGLEEDSAVVAPVDPGAVEGENLQVSFEEPEEVEEDTSSLPSLTSGEDDEAYASDVIVTRDGVQHRDGAAVADADVEPEQLSGLMAEAEAAEARGNLQDAVLHYGDLLSLQPSHLAAHLGRGRCLVELGDYAAAMSDFQRSEDLAPDAPDPIVEMGNLFFARKEYRKAITYFDQAIELDPEHAMAWCRRGICHQYRKDYARAVDDLERAASLDPDVPNLQRYVQMARKAMERGRR